MSLIHEALSKARREASHQDDPGVVFPGGLTGRRRRRGLGTGVILGIVVTVAAGAIIGLGLWWAIRQTPAGTTAHADSTAGQIAKSAVPEAGTRTSSSPEGPGRESTGVHSESAPAAEISPTPAIVTPAPGSRESNPAVEDGRDAEVEIDTTHVTPVAKTATSPRGREFLVDADLGYATLSLDYIMVSPTESFAQINGLEVRVGGHIEGFTVEEITENRVTLRDEKGPLVIKVPPSR